MNFKQAEENCKKGIHMRRPHWHQERSIVFNQKGFWRMCINGTPTNWYQSRSEDLKAIDWEEFILRNGTQK